MVGKAKRIRLSGIKPVKESRGMAVPAPSAKSNRAAMDKQEREWRAESDARALSDAAAIYADPARARLARQAASKLVREQESKLANLRAITKKGAF
jgi:hypothetical protein